MPMRPLIARRSLDLLAGAVALFGLALTPPPAAAQGKTAQEAGRQGVGSIKSAAPSDALNKAEQNFEDAWLASPLVFRRALLVAGPAEGYGIFNPRESSVFDGKTPLRIYAEPIGYGWGKSGELNEISMTIDLLLKDADGKELARQDAFQKVSLKSRAHNKEFLLNLTLTFDDAPAGSYVAIMTVHDQVTGKSGSFEIPFQIKP